MEATWSASDTLGLKTDKIFGSRDRGEGSHFVTDLADIGEIAVLCLSSTLVRAAAPLNRIESATWYSSAFGTFSEADIVMPTKSKLLDAIGRIRQLYLAPTGLKGPGSIPPSETAKLDAESFVRQHLTEEVGVPHIGIDGDGDFSFFWKTPCVKLNIVLAGDHTYAFYAELKNGKAFSGDDIKIDVPLPAEISEALSSCEHYGPLH